MIMCVCVYIYVMGYLYSIIYELPFQSLPCQEVVRPTRPPGHQGPGQARPLRIYWSLSGSGAGNHGRVWGLGDRGSVHLVRVVQGTLTY